MEKAPHVLSIIIPLHRPTQEDLISCLESISLNEEDSWEVLLVDEGNEEKVVKEMEYVASYYPWVRILHQEASGAAAARNLGIREASGSYLTFLEVTDGFAPGVLDRLSALLLETGPDVLITQLSKREDAHWDSGKVLSVLPESVVPFTPTAGVPFERLRLFILGGEDSLLQEKKAWIGRSLQGRFVEASLARQTLFHTDLAFGEEVVWNFDLLGGTGNVLLLMEPCMYGNGKKQEEEGYRPLFPVELDKLLRLYRREIATWPERDRVYYYNAAMSYFDRMCRCYVFAERDGKEKERFLTEVRSPFWRRIFKRCDEKSLSIPLRMMVGLGRAHFDEALYQFCKTRCQGIGRKSSGPRGEEKA